MMKKIQSFKNNLILIVFLFLLILGESIYSFFDGGVFKLTQVETTNLEEIKNNITKQASSISIKQKINGEYLLYTNDTLQLTLIDDINTALINAWNYNWLSSDSRIVTVSSTGVILGKNPGTAIIRVTNKNDVNLFDTISIRVVNKENSLSFMETSDKINVILGEIKKLEINTGGDVSINDLIWSTSNNEVITINEGYLCAKGLGEAIITVKSGFDSSYQDSISILVYDTITVVIPPNSIDISHLFINKNEIEIKDINNININLEDELIINASSDTLDYSQVIFTPLTDNVCIKKVESYLGTFIFTDIGEKKIKVNNKYDNTIETILEFYVDDINKDITDFTLQTPYEIENNEIVIKLAINEINTINVSNDNKLINIFDYFIKIENEEIIINNDNYLLPLKEGSTNIEVIYKYNHLKRVKVKIDVLPRNDELINVDHIYFENVKLNNNKYNLKTYKDNYVNTSDLIIFKLLISPVIASYKNNYMVYTSDDKIASVTTTNELDVKVISINFKQKGKVTIGIKFYDDIEEKIELNFIVDDYIEPSYIPFEVEMTIPNIIRVEKTYKVDLNIINPNNSIITYKYYSSNKELAIIGDEGNVLGVDEGNVIISLVATDGMTTITKEQEIIVIKEHYIYDKVTSMTCNTYLLKDNKYEKFDLGNEALNVYQKAYLNITVNPNYNNNNNYEVISLNPDIINVYYANYMYQLYALSSGKATIRIINYEDSSLSQEIEIKVCEIIPKYVIPQIESGTLTIGNKEELNFIIDNKATYAKMTYELSTKGVIEIIDDTIIPLHTGATTIIINIEEDNNKYTLSIPIKVQLPNSETSLTIRLLLFFILHGVCYLLIGISLFNINKIILSKKLLIIIMSILIITPDIIRVTTFSWKLLLFTIIVNCISIIIGYLLMKLIKRKKKGLSELNV